jgi:methylglutaconyl-CoA hydratase
MMGYALLTFEVDARGVAAVTLNRPEIHNAFDDRLIAELTQVFGEIDGNDAVRLAVLSGNGKSFCAGGDLNWMRSLKAYSREENIADANRLAAMYERIRFCTKPTLAVVHGAALGGGSGLAAVCDYVLAADNARFGFTEVRLGIVPGTISPFVIEKIGAANARAYFLSGMPFSAGIAQDIGLVQRVLPYGELQAAREETIEEFLKAGPEAAARSKILINEISKLMREAGDPGSATRRRLTDHSVAAIAEARVSDEGQEGMDALLTKRKASWML